MRPRPCCSHQRPEKTLPAQGRWCWASESLEIGIAALCSIVTWEYTVQNEVSLGYDGVLGQHAAERDAVDFLFRPPPGLMLFSCLVFGCCVSSFTHRRQSQDPLQFVVYIVLLLGAGMAGYGARANVHLILLGYLPWATCAAMAISISGHSLYRWRRLDVGTGHKDEEKAQLVGCIAER